MSRLTGKKRQNGVKTGKYDDPYKMLGNKSFGVFVVGDVRGVT